MRAVTISREYGSGGGEIATRLAKRLGWQLIDHAIVERVASELGASTQEAEVHDEHAESVLTLQRKAKGLSTKTGEFGPAAGLSRYPAQPEDFPSLTR